MSIQNMIIAGYHGDTREFTRVYTESRVSLKRANEAFYKGVEMRNNGKKCKCNKCNEN